MRWMKRIVGAQPCRCMDDCFFYAGEADVAKALVVKGR